MVINWQKGFNRLWLFLSITFSAIITLLAAIDGAGAWTLLVTIVCFVIPFVIGHIVFKVVLWIIKGFRDGR